MSWSNAQFDFSLSQMSGPGDSIRQDASGEGAIAAQIVGDNNKLTITAGGTRLVLDQKHLHAGDRPPKDERELLMTEWRATTLVGRRPELDSFKAWRDDPVPVAVRCVTGKAGSGKTRLAIEACEEAEEEEWAAGFVAADELTRFHQAENLARWHSPEPTLVVIDDAAVSVAMIKRWLDVLAQDAPAGAKKLRILLLERHAEPDSDYGWWATLTRIESRDNRTAGDLIGGARPEPLAMLTAPEERQALFAQAMQLAAKVLGKPELAPPAPGEDPEFERRIADDRLENEPLFLMMAAIVAIDRGTSRALALSRVELAEDVADFERARLARLGASRGLGADGDLIGHLAACATLQRGCSFATARAMVAEELQAMGLTAPLPAEKLAMLLAEALPAPDGMGIDRVRPDLIGEAFALKEIIGSPARPEAERFAIVERARTRDAAAVLETLILCAQDLAKGAADHASVRWLAAFSEQSNDPLELMQIAAALPASTLALRELGARIAERIVAALRNADIDTPGFLTIWLISLGHRLTALGQHEEALEAEQEALTRLRAHSSGRDDAEEPIIADLLNNLSISLSDLGRREEALAMAHEAVTLHRALAAARPDAFKPNLATSLNSLANNLTDLGRREEALAVAQEAAKLCRALAAARPDAFAPILATSLNSLANSLTDLGRREEALAVAQEAVVLRRALAASRPDAFTPDLAGSLASLASRLSDLGRREEALSAAQEAAELYRALTAERPDAFTPELALSLNNLANRLSDLGRHEEALATAQEAVVLRRALAAARPDAFTPNLAMSLNNLASRFANLGRREEALAAAQEALELRRVLAAAQPDAFTPGLATSLNNIVHHLSALDRREEALAAAQEAVDLRRILVAARPDAFTHNLATSLGALGALRVAVGAPADALESFREALALLSPYFLALPAAHAPRIMALCQDYCSCAETAGIEPDWTLLAPIAEVLQPLMQMEDRDGN